MRQSAQHGARRGARAALVGLSSLLGVVAACGPEQQPATVIVLVLDSVTSALLADESPDGGISRDRTPHLARFAEAATVFTDHVSASTGTNAAMATLVSGSPPWEHGVGSLRQRGRGRLSASFVTHAERFADAGYATFAAVALPQLRAGFSGLLQGFDTIVEPALDPRAAWTSAELWSRCAAPLEQRLQGSDDVFALLYLADQRARLRALSQPSAGLLIRRLAAFRGQDTRIDGALRLAATDPVAALEELEACLGRGRGSAAHAALQAAKSDAALGELDRCFGQLLDLLEDTGRARTASVLVIGGAPAATPDGQARFPGERVLTPCLLRLFGERDGRRLDGTVQSTGVWAEILDRHGLPADAIGELAEPGPVMCVNTDRSAGAAFDQNMRVELVAGQSARLFRRSDGARVERDTLDAQATQRVDWLAGALTERLTRGTWRIDAELESTDELRIGWRFAGGVVRATQIGSQPIVHAAQVRASGATTLTDAPMGLTLFASALDLPLRLRLGGPAFVDFDPARYFFGESSFERLPVLWLPCKARTERATQDGDSALDGSAPMLDLEHQGRGWWQLSVAAPDGQRVRALLALFPPTELDQLLEVDLAAHGGSLEPVPGRRDACWVSGTAPFRMLLRKDPGSELALHVEIEGVALEPARLRVGGRPYALADEVELYLPDWMPGLTEALDGDAQLAAQSNGPGAARVRIMRDADPQIERTAFDAAQLEFVRRLGPNE